MTEAKLNSSDLFALPLSCEYDETGGYDCMSSGYDILDATGNTICTIDVGDIERDRKNCDYGESVRARRIAEWIVSCANTQAEISDEQEGRQ